MILSPYFFGASLDARHCNPESFTRSTNIGCTPNSRKAITIDRPVKIAVSQAFHIGIFGLRPMFSGSQAFETAS